MDRGESSENKYDKEELNYLKEEINKLGITNLTGIDENLCKSLLYGFEELIVSLRKDLDDNTPVLLQQLYGVLYDNILISPGKVIMEIIPDSTLSKSVTFEPNSKFSLGKNYFSFIENITILPIKISSYNLIPSFNFNEQEQRLNTNTTHLLKIVITPLNLPLRTLNLSDLRFFIDGVDGEDILMNLFQKSNLLEVIVMDSEIRDENNPRYTYGTISYTIPSLGSNIGILEDYGKIKEIYQFFTLKNIDLSNIFSNLVIYIPINSFKESKNFRIKLFNFIGINLFPTTTNPLTIDLKNLDQHLLVNEFQDNLEIYKINGLYTLKKNKTIENWYSYEKNGAIYLSFLLQDQDPVFLNEEKIYGEVLVHNGKATEQIKIEDPGEIINYRNFPAYVTYISQYVEKTKNINKLRTYLNTDFKLMTDNPKLFQKSINDLLFLYCSSMNLFIDQVKISKTYTTDKWINIPVYKLAKNISMKINTNQKNIWIFLQVLKHFINNLSYRDDEIIFTVEWKGRTYVV